MWLLTPVPSPGAAGWEDKLGAILTVGATVTGTHTGWLADTVHVSLERPQEVCCARR